MKNRLGAMAWCAAGLVVLCFGSVRAQTGLSGMGMVSRWAADIGRATYPSLPAPTTPFTLRWKLSPSTDHAYHYRQELHALHQMSTVSAMQDVDASGTLTVHADGDKSRVVLSDVQAKMTEQQHGTGDDKPQTSEASAPNVDLPDFEADGSVSHGDSAWSPVLRLVFPLPPTPTLAAGATADVPMRVALKVMGAPVNAVGPAHVTLKGYNLVAGRPCARLEAVIDLDKVDLPDEVARNYAVRVRGRSVAYFDTEAGAFRCGELALLSSLRLSMLVPGEPTRRKKNELVPPSTATYVDDNDMYLQLSDVTAGPAPRPSPAPTKK